MAREVKWMRHKTKGSIYPWNPRITPEIMNESWEFIDDPFKQKETKPEPMANIATSGFVQVAEEPVIVKNKGGRPKREI